MTPAEVADRMNGIHISESVCGQSTGEYLKRRASFLILENTRRLASGPLTAFFAQKDYQAQVPFYNLLHVHFASSRHHRTRPLSKPQEQTSRARFIVCIPSNASEGPNSETLATMIVICATPGIYKLHPQNCPRSPRRSTRSSPSSKT